MVLIYIYLRTLPHLILLQLYAFYRMLMSDKGKTFLLLYILLWFLLTLNVEILQLVGYKTQYLSNISSWSKTSRNANFFQFGWHLPKTKTNKYVSFFLILNRWWRSWWNMACVSHTWRFLEFYWESFQFSWNSVKFPRCPGLMTDIRAVIQLSYRWPRKENWFRNSLNYKLSKIAGIFFQSFRPWYRWDVIGVEELRLK